MNVISMEVIVIHIYKIECVITGKVYIGASKDIDKRLWQHENDLKNNHHHNKAMQYDWNLYSRDNFIFEILEECDHIFVDDRERYWIDYYGGLENIKTYNLQSGGVHGFSYAEKVLDVMREKKKGIEGNSHPRYGVAHTEESKMKISEHTKGRVPWNKGVPRTEETKKKISEANKGKISYRKGITMSEEDRQKLRDSLKDCHLGKKHSKETRQKMSASQMGNKNNLGKKRSEETRKKQSESAKIGWLKRKGLIVI